MSTETRIIEVKKSTARAGYKQTLVHVACGKIEAYVSFNSFGPEGSVNVCTLNASHKAFRGLGKLHDSLEAALAYYSKPATHALIRAAHVEHCQHVGLELVTA